MRPGEVTLPSMKMHGHCYAHSGSPDEAERRTALCDLEQSVRVVGGPVQSDKHGFGVIATRPLAAGQVLLDRSVFYIARPSDYALAHLPQFHALEFGRDAYFQLREPVIGHCSLSYFVNEARHGGSLGIAANVAYKAVRPRGGGVALGLHILTPIEAGSELLADYDQRLKAA
uniref:SET domain-containing protein n=1 Tax=Coccolithus braarudii TaxID=221442 RepID=A0A7S0L6E3_9EUKA